MKKTYFDVMRIVAIVLVLMNHQPAYKLYYSQDGVCEILALIEAMIIRVNVPLFAMISGALLLGREETLTQLWKKRISRILWIIFLFSGLLYLELGWLRNRDMSLDVFIYGVVSGSLKNLTSYWFLYAYLGFLLMLPFLRKVALGMTKYEFIWLMGIHIVIGSFIPLVNFIMSLCGYDVLTLPSPMVVSLSCAPLFFYPLIGYYIDQNVDVEKINKRQWIIVMLCCVLGIIFTAFVVYIEGKTRGFTQHYIDLFNYINIIAVFLVLKRLFSVNFQKAHIRATSIISLFSSLVFGIYLLDLAVQLPIYEYMKNAMMPVIGKFAYSFIWCITSVIIGGFITFILKQFPYIKRLL